MTAILSLWDVIVGSTAVAVVMVIGLMIGFIDVHRGLRRLRAMVGTVAPLLILPSILVGLWHSLSVLQQLGIVSLFGILGTIALFCGPRHRKKRRGDQ